MNTEDTGYEDTITRYRRECIVIKCKHYICRNPEIIGTYREKKKNWITKKCMDMCDLRRTLKHTQFEPGNKYKLVM